MKKLTKRILSVVMVLTFALTCVLATSVDAQAASKSKSMKIQGPKTTLIQWNAADSDGNAIDTNVKVTIEIVSVGKNAKSVQLTTTGGDNVLKISGKKLKKGYKKSVTIANKYGTERLLKIKGKVKIKVTLKPESGSISYFDTPEDAG